MTLIRSQWKRYVLPLVIILFGLYLAFSPRAYAIDGETIDITVTVDAPYACNVLKDVATTVHVTAHASLPPVHKYGHHLTAPTYTFNLVSAQYTTTDPGPDFDWSTATAASGGTDFDTDLDATQFVGSNANPSDCPATFQFTPHVKGYWHIVVSASVVWYEQGVHNIDIWRHKGCAVSSPMVDDYSLIAVTATVKAWSIDPDPAVTPDWKLTSEIAAGGIASPAHQTDVRITVDPAVEAKVVASLTGGIGQAANAKLVFDGSTIDPNNATATIYTGSNGQLIGTLTSSDLTSSNATIICGDGSVVVSFAWDNYHGCDKWSLSPDYIVLGGSSSIAVILAHNHQAMNGHTVLFTIEKIYYVDENGVEQVDPLLNTPEHPSDLSDWADFTEPDAPTDSNGVAYATIHFKALCVNATWLQLRVYDMTVTDAGQ